MKRGITHFWTALAGALCLATAAPAAIAKAPDGFAGHWQYDAAASSFTGRTPYASAKLSLSAEKKSIKYVGDFTMADGKTAHVEYGGVEDGSDMAVTGSPTYDSVTHLRPDRNTLIRTERRGGKVVGTTIVTLAKDGKSFSASSRGTLPDGHQYTATTVWKRVKK